MQYVLPMPLGKALPAFGPRMIILIAGEPTAHPSAVAFAILTCLLQSDSSAVVTQAASTLAERDVFRQAVACVAREATVHPPIIQRMAGETPRATAERAVQAAALGRQPLVLADALRPGDVVHVARHSQAAGKALIAVQHAPLLDIRTSDRPVTPRLADLVIACELADDALVLTVVPRAVARTFYCSIPLHTLESDPTTALFHALVSSDWAEVIPSGAVVPEPPQAQAHDSSAQIRIRNADGGGSVAIPDPLLGEIALGAVTQLVSERDSLRRQLAHVRAAWLGIEEHVIPACEQAGRLSDYEAAFFDAMREALAEPTKG